MVLEELPCAVMKSPRHKAKDTADSLLGMTMMPCLDDKVGDELPSEELNALAGRIEDAVEDEITATLRENRGTEMESSVS